MVDLVDALRATKDVLRSDRTIEARFEPTRLELEAADEIERLQRVLANHTETVTPEMIEAGRFAFLPNDVLPSEDENDVLRRVFVAMAKARQS